MNSRVDVKVGLSGCFIILVIFAINFFVGGFFTDYILWTCFAKDIPWYADCIIGLIGGEFIVPMGIVVWILTFFIAAPFFI